MESSIFSSVRLAAAAALVLASFTYTNSFAGPDLVTSDSAGIPLVDDSLIPHGYHAADVSNDGRYVLLKNYDRGFGLDANTGGQIFPENCQILRKDRVSGELLTVFESDSEGYEFCSDARISADGNLVAASPTNTVACAGGVITTLVVRNINNDHNTKVSTNWVPGSPGDIARICPPDGNFRLPGQTIHSLTGSGNFAVLIDQAVIGGLIQAVYEIVDVAAGTVEPISIATEEGVSPWIRGVALSEDGNKIAVNAILQTPYIPNPGIPSPGPIICDQTGNCESGAGGQPTGPSAVILCGQVGRCDSLSGPIAPANWWQFPVPAEPGSNNIFLLDRIAGWQALPAALTELPSGVALQANAWSADSSRISFIEVPEFVRGCFFNTPDGPAECFPADACTAADCELTVHHFDTLALTVASYQTDYDPDTLSMCSPNDGATSVVTNLNCTPKLSRDGDRLLFARAVANPFGGDWQANPVTGSYTCVSRASLADPELAPEIIDCPLGGGGTGPCLPGPLPGTINCQPEGPTFPSPLGTSGGTNSLNNFFQPSVPGLGDYNSGPCYSYPDCNSYFTGWSLGAAYHAPVNWYVLDIPAGHTSHVSVTSEGELFQSDGTLFSDNGYTIVFRSQDPRLQNDDPEALAAEEASLDEACFWSPAGSSSNLRVATNDNVAFVVEDEYNVYRETPVFCPVPDPALTAHEFAADLGGVDAAVISFRNWRSGSGSMQTWFGNFSPNPATLVVLTIEVSGLSEAGSVSLDEEPNCEIYTPATAADSYLIRCEIDALAAGEFRVLRWEMADEGRRVMVRATSQIEANEAELRPRSNSSTRRIMLFNWDWSKWFRNWR